LVTIGRRHANIRAGNGSRRFETEPEWAMAAAAGLGALRTACAVATVAALLPAVAGCGAERVLADAIVQPPATAAVACHDVDARATVQALFNVVTAGRSVDLAAYFVAASQFVRWVDPDSGEIVAGPGPSGGRTLDALQSRLDHLADRVSIRLVAFRNQGYVPDGGGDAFTFTVLVQPAPDAVVGPGQGRGVMDCSTGRIKEFAIDRW
jgi:hypothetical protein